MAPEVSEAGFVETSNGDLLHSKHAKRMFVDARRRRKTPPNQIVYIYMRGASEHRGGLGYLGLQSNVIVDIVSSFTYSSVYE